MFLSKRYTELERTEYLADGLTPEQAKKQRSKWLKIFDFSGSIATAIIIIFVVFTFICRPTSVVGTSMVPTLQNGDWLIATPQKEYKYGDIVIITQPNVHNEPLIKRVIATEGQTVDINFTSGQVMVDNVELDEPYIAEPTTNPSDVQFPVQVPDGMVFVMGDNRNHSSDSRSSGVGFIDTRYILGKAEWRILPFGNFDIYENFNKGEANGN